MPPFRLQYASNLFVDSHRQKYTTLLRPAASVLALLGNIGRPDSPKTYHFLKYCASNWDTVFLIPGPHEFTNLPEGRTTYPERITQLHTLCQSVPSVRCGTPGEFPFHTEEILLLGASLWTPLSFPLRGQPEFDSIYTSVDEAGPIPLCHHARNSLYKSDLRFLKERTLFWSIVHPQMRVVYLTHTLPTPALLSSELSEGTYKRLPLDCRTFPTPPALRAWVGGATGSCASASGPIQTGVNSLFEYPYHPVLRSGSYDPERVLEIDSIPFLPPARPSLPSLRVPKVSLSFA